MPITRQATPADNFTMIPNSWVRDARLSWKARGLLGYLMSHRPGWSTSVASLVESAPDGRDAVRAGIAELEALGYLIRGPQLHGEAGRFTEADYRIVDPFAPASDYPTTAGLPSADPPPKKNSSTEEQEPEHQQQQRAGRATEKQVEFIRDLYTARGGWITAEREAEWLALSIAEADALIQEYRAEPPWRRKQAGGF